MTVLFGTIGAASNNTDAMGAMQAALATWHADDSGLWCGDGTALGALVSWNTPEARSERQPVRHAETGVVLVADVRLDNREELLQQLVPPGLPADVGDAALILHAWLRWGEDCADRLIGDFAFALWDPRRKQLYCARDLFGCRPLFYAQVNSAKGSGFVFASSPAGVLAHPMVDRTLHEPWLVDFVGHLPRPLDRTPFAAVHRLPPAHWLSLRDGRLTLRRYWEPRPGSLSGLAGAEAMVEECRHLLDRAVVARLRSNGVVGAELSDGLDSGGVTATAHKLLRQQGEDLPVFSWLRHPSHAYLGPDEREGVTATTDHLGLTRRFAPDNFRRSMTGIVDDAIDDHAMPLSALPLFSGELYELAAGKGARTLLTGIGGDECFSTGYHSLADEWARRGQWDLLWRHCRSWTARRGGSALRMLARTTLSARWPTLWQRLRPQHGRDLADMVTARFFAPPDYAKRHDLLARCLVTQRERLDPGSAFWDRDRRIVLLGDFYNLERLESMALLTQPLKMECRHPLLDRRLIEFVLAWPPEMCLRDGWGRWMARRTLEDRLPPSIAWAPAKSTAVNPSLDRLLVDKATVAARIKSMHDRPAVRERIDPDRLLSILDTIRPGSPFPKMPVFGPISSALQMDAFLTRYG